MSTDATPVFDAEKLRRQTLGDETMQVEVLSLFVTEAERLMRQVEAADSSQLRAERLRALIALGRNIGAMRLVQSARMAESHIGDDDPDLSGLRAAISDTVAYVHRSGI
jgi:hypothetical protein